jgi:hypothetical protein
MSELALTTSATTAPAAAPQWLEVEAVAQLLNCSDRHVRRRCGEEWFALKLARQFNEPGKKPRWQVRSDADPALGTALASLTVSPVPAAASKVDLRQLPEKARAIASQRLVIVQRWEQAVSAGATLGMSRDQATDQFLKVIEAEGLKVSRRTLYNWGNGFKRDGLAGLVDGRYMGEAGEQTDDPFLKQIEAYWLKQNKLKLTVCYEMAKLQAAEKGWQICSYRAAARHIENIKKVKAGVVLQLRHGEEAFTNEIDRVITRDYTSINSNDIWNADHHQFDVMVKVGERVNKETGEITPIFARPWLTAWQDCRSRKIVGYVIRAADPNTEVILEALRLGCLNHGVPRHAYSDNGKDFDSQALTGETKSMRWAKRKVRVEHDQKRMAGIYAQLGIKHMHALPYHGQSKPIERFFGTVEDRFGRLHETYCGRNTLEKPEQLQAKLNAGKAPSLEEFVAGFADWLEVDYHQRVHTGDGMMTTPDQAFISNLQVKRTAPAEVLEVLLQRRVGPVTIGQTGFVVNRVWYGETETAHMFGQKIFVRIDDRDISRVSMWDEADRFIGYAQTNRKVGWLDTQGIREATAEKKRQRRNLRAAAEDRLRLHEDVLDTALRAAAEKARPATHDSSSPPPGISPIRTDIEGQLPGIQNNVPMPLKKAVGDDTPHRPFTYQSRRADHESDDGSTAGFVYHGRSADGGDQ